MLSRSIKYSLVSNTGNGLFVCQTSLIFVQLLMPNPKLRGFWRKLVKTDTCVDRGRRRFQL